MHGSMWRATLENVAQIPLRGTSNHAYVISLYDIYMERRNSR